MFAVVEPSQPAYFGPVEVGLKLAQRKVAIESKKSEKVAIGPKNRHLTEAKKTSLYAI